MSLNSPLFYVIPDETIQVAKAAFPKGNRYLLIRDTFGPLFHNPDFQSLFSHTGQPGQDPARLALITILPFAERLSDEQAADAVRSRIDWKYLLALPLTDSGFDASVLSEFRTRLVDGNAEHLLFDTLLLLFRQQGLLRSRGRQRSDSTHVLAAVRALNRLACVGSTMRHALNSLAVVAPDWLLTFSQPEWLDRYAKRFEDERIPEAAAERTALATDVGHDGLTIRTAVLAADAPAWLRSIPAIETLRRVWIQNDTWTEQETFRWRTNEETPPAGQYISSPYDHDCRSSQKRGLTWIGYNVHLTESCDADLPHLMTNVETTTATTSDDAVTEHIHEALKQRDLLPAIHVADTGSIDAELLIESDRRYRLDLLGPVRGDYHRQAQAGNGFAAADFLITWEARQVTCPAEQTSISWTPAVDNRGHPVITITFSMKDCQPCTHREACTDGKRRSVTVRPQEQHQALQARRQRQQTLDFKRASAKRAGVEGTMSQSVRSCGVRHARSVGLPKTRLQHLAPASALNL